MRSVFIKFSIIALFSLVLFSCARRGNPTGGSKDTIPPVMVKTIPPMETINFEDKKIRIYFDEYIKLEKVNEQLVISPPQKNDPIIIPLGTASKFINIKILDTLDNNTTYSFNFGRSIVDNNEGNELGNFKYVFSTGDYIDSLMVAGEVTDPMVKGTTKNVDVMLYEYDSSYTDSIIFKEKPRYIANTLDSTVFELTNLKAGKYLMIALRDANRNKIYNPEVDKIGYIPDTVTLPTDENFIFSVFREVPDFSLLKPKEINKGHLMFGYLGNPKGLQIDIISEVPEDFHYEIVYEKDKDTLNYWYTPVVADSLNFRVTKGDYSEEVTSRIRSTEIDSLKISNSTSSVLHLRDTFHLKATVPLIEVDTSKVFIMDQDSIPQKFDVFISKQKLKLYINFEKTPGSSYQMELLPNLVTDIFGLTNDSLIVNLNTKLPEEYGIIKMDINGPADSGYIVELLTPKEEVLRTQIIDKPEQVVFDLLNPGNYLVRVTKDENKNGKWDTGNFLKRKLPEEIKYFENEIEIRANWEKPEIFRFD